MIDTAIIGIGSPHGNDSLGWELVRELELRCPDPDRYFFYNCYGHPGEWINMIPECRRIIFADAALTDKPTGEIRFFVLDKMPDTIANSFQSSHGIGLLDSIKLAQTLQTIPQQIEILLIETFRINIETLDNSENKHHHLNQIETIAKQLFC